MPSRVLLIAVCVFAAYFGSLRNGFVWDDTYFLTDMPYLRDPALWWRSVLEPLFVSGNYFRPLPLLSFVAEYRLAGLDAFAFHLTNLLLPAFNTTLVVVLARQVAHRTGPDSEAVWKAAGAGLLFGLHPALIETVCWISDRFDLMMAGFLLAALLADSTMSSTRPRAATVCLLFLLALLCKETAVILFALLPLWRLALQAVPEAGWLARLGQLATTTLRSSLLLLPAAATCLGLRYLALGALYRADSMIVPGNALQHFLLTTKTLGWYLWLLVWPFGQVGPVHPGLTPVPLHEPWGWLGMLLLVGILVALVRMLRHNWTTALLLSCALVSLVPVVHLVPLTIGDNIVHDRYLLLGLAFTALALASVPCPKRRWPVFASGFVWLALSLAAIYSTVPRWESNLSLWSWAHARAPDSSIARGNYLAALVNTGGNAAALDVAREMLQASPDNPVAIYDMALALMRLGRDAEAKAYCRQALQRFARSDAKGRLDVAEAWNLLGYLSLRADEWDDAETSLQAAIRESPYLTRPHFNLAMLYYGRGRIAEGDRALDFALRHDAPEMAVIHRTQAAEKRAESIRRYGQ